MRKKELLLNNFNEKLKEITKSLNLKIKNPELFKIAFTHQSFANEHHVESNERLEYLGDAILDFLVAEYLYTKYPNIPEGTLTKIRAKYVCANANMKYAQKFNLDEALLLGKGELEQGGRGKESVLGDLFEAFLGAIYLDLGMDHVKKILEKEVFPNIEIEDEGFFIDYKSKLQEFIQAESRETVKYVHHEATGEAHNKTFKASVYHDGVKLGTGVGKRKKDAEQEAARDALEKLATN